MKRTTKKMKQTKKRKNGQPKNNTKKGRIPLTIKRKMQQYSEMMKLRCSPNPSNKNNSFSCLEDDALYKLRDLWNARHHDAQINTNDSREIWEKLKLYMGKTCNKESCWLKQHFVGGKMDNELTKSFAPAMPDEWKKKPDEWLSSLDILNVMKQYEASYKCFEFLGPSPIDFDTHKLHGDCVWEELCHFNLQDQIDSQKTKIGIVFNMDTHDKPGSHWTSMFINIKRGKIFYFDSAGNRIPKKIKALVDRITVQGKSLKKDKIKFTFDQNYPVEHQYGSSACGMYALYFIVHLLEDRHTEDYFKTHVLTDEYIEQFRKIYYNTDL